MNLSGSILGKVKKIEAQAKWWFSYKKSVMSFVVVYIICLIGKFLSISTVNFKYALLGVNVCIWVHSLCTLMKSGSIYDSTSKMSYHSDTY